MTAVRPRRRVPPRQRIGKPPTTHVGVANPTGLPMLRTSERKDFKRCPQRWWWAWVEQLREKGPPNDKLWFGTGWHLVMAHWYQPGKKRGKDPIKVWREWVGDELTHIRVNISGHADYKEETYIEASKLGEQMIENYIEEYGRDESWSIIQVEKPFEVTVVSPAGIPRVIYCGTYDGVYRDERSGKVMLLEHKSAKNIYTGHLDMDDQAGSYLMIATRELRAAGLISPREEVHGIMYNFARKSVKNDKPRNADGLVTNAPKKEDYLAQLHPAAIKTLGPKPTLAQLQQLAIDTNRVVLGEVSKVQPAKLFERIVSYRNRHERNAMVTRVQAEVEHMTAMRRGTLPIYKTPTRDCSWDCSFYRMCLLTDQGGADAEELKRMLFKREDPYIDHRKSAAGDD